MRMESGEFCFIGPPENKGKTSMIRQHDAKRDTQRVAIRRSGGGEAFTTPLAESTVPAGFPSPADDSREELDFTAHVVRNPESTFFLRVSGESMTGAGIFHGDLLVVDRSLEPCSGDIVIAVLDGEFTVKRLRRRGSRVELLPENPRFRKIVLQEESTLEIWGVVTGAYKSFR